MARDSILDIQDILNEYSSDIQELIDEEANKIAKEAQNELKSSSPKGKRGKYAKGWRVKSSKGKGYTENIVYNTEYQLTHLLEKGHRITRNGQRVGVAGAKVHIKPVEQKAIKEYEKRVENGIKKG